MVRADAAEHEAAHVVVGLAVGLQFKRAALLEVNPKHLDPDSGYCWFLGHRTKDRLALGIMYCAGAAWEAQHGRPAFARGDLKLARNWLGLSAADVRAATRIARELLDSRRRVHARIASELCDRDLTARDVAGLVLDL